MNKTFTIYTLGCKVNSYESDRLADKLLQEGYVQSENGVADICIINSCTVTAQGDKKARQAISRFKTQNPDCVVVLTGCYPQAFPEKAQQIEKADIVTGTADKDRLPQIINDYIDNQHKIINITGHSKTFEINSYTPSTKTRALIKIEDGCDRYCTYCIIPKARGPVRSRTPESIREEAEFLASQGNKEVVLVGINLACYGRKEGLSLADAVEAVCGVGGIERVRVGSLEPELITPDEMQRMAAQAKFCPHFHMSLQSGCDATLKRMKRRYDTKEYLDIAENLRKFFPSCAITTDIMVGFPGESEAEFEESLAFVEKVGFAKIHVFPYSVREGTKAANFDEQIMPDVKNLRAKRMGLIAKTAEQAFLDQQVGTTQDVLIEKRTSEFYINGHTPNYTPVRIFGGEADRHSILKVKITEVMDDYCIGEEIR